MTHELKELRVVSVLFVTITDELIAKVAEKTGEEPARVKRYLETTEQSSKLLDAFLFFGVGLFGKFPETRPA